jgi:hypothetical protein
MVSITISVFIWSGIVMPDQGLGDVSGGFAGAESADEPRNIEEFFKPTVVSSSTKYDD